MKISLQWLRELCPTTLSNDEIAQRLTAVGFEVEGREERRLPEQHPEAGAPAGVVAARVIVRAPIAGSDHLSLCEVDDGTQIWKVVCGAQNYAAGDVVPLARVGAELPGGMKIKAAKLRGQESFGMLCSAKELGLSDDHSGLLHLPHETKLGTPVESLLGLPDTILEINVTPNRPDALSHLGIARELAAALGAALRIGHSALANEAVVEKLAQARVDVKEPARCPRYLARVIEGLKIGPSPMQLQERLRACGVRAINNVVDATNLALLELGHPLHAFDLDKLKESRIEVRLARADEKMITLDGKERVLAAEDLLICDGEGPVALAGIMGGQTSEVSDATARILLESALFDGPGTRRTAKRQGLKTEASARFEKGADEETARRAVDRCAELIVQLAGGKVVAGAIDVWPEPHRKPAQIWVRPARVAQTLGASINAQEVETRLASLGLNPLEGTAERRLWQVPGYRRDLTREIDCVEEIARQRGLDTIPITQHLAGVGTTQRRTQAELATAAVRATLAARGFDEAVNYSFVADRDLEALEPIATGETMIAVARPIRVQNPLTVEQGAMRTSMLAGLLRNLQHNLARGTADVRLYELGRVYLGTRDPRHPEGPLSWPVAEPRRLGLAFVGRGAPRFWAAPKAGELDSAGAFYAMKGAVEELCQALQIPQISFSTVSAGHPVAMSPPRSPLDISTRALHPAFSAVLHLGHLAEGPHAAPVAGAFGQLHPSVAKAFDLPANVVVAELDWELLIEKAGGVAQSHGVPRFPAVARDLSFTVAANVPAAAIRAEIRSADSAGLLEAIEPFDVYRGAPVPADKKSVAWSLTLRAADRTLTDAEADALIQAVIARLRERVGAEIRA